MSSRKADDVVKTADVAEAEPGDTITYTIEITNFANEATDYTITDVLPDGVTYARFCYWRRGLSF